MPNPVVLRRRIQAAALHPDTKSYRDRIFANGGFISSQDLAAYDRLAVKPINQGFRVNIVEFGFLHCDNNAVNKKLNTAAVKLYWRNSSLIQWVNFVEGNLSRSGMTGTGSAYGVLNISTNDIGADGGLAVYMKTVPSGSGSTQIGEGGTGNLWIAHFGAQLNSIFSGLATFGGNPGPGLYSVSAGSAGLYREGVKLSNQVDALVLNSNSLHLFQRNNSPTQTTDQTLGCYAITKGMTPGKELQLSKIVSQTMAFFGKV